jgi:CHASE1-domain containing sensor protein
MTVPTRGEIYSQLIEHLRKAQEASATISHLDKLNDDHVTALGWMTVSEGLKRMQMHVTNLARGRIN